MQLDRSDLKCKALLIHLKSLTSSAGLLCCEENREQTRTRNVQSKTKEATRRLDGESRTDSAAEAVYQSGTAVSCERMAPMVFLGREDVFT